MYDSNRQIYLFALQSSAHEPHRFLLFVFPTGVDIAVFKHTFHHFFGIIPLEARPDLCDRVDLV
jgi:hypothetical protein